MLKKLFNAEQILNSYLGQSAGAYGGLGEHFGFQGAKFGEQGMEGVPKYDPHDYFKMENYFDTKSLFDPDALANQVLGDALSVT